MRKLNADDLFTFSSMVKETNVKEEFAKLSAKTAGKKNLNVKEIGTELVLNIVSNCATKEAKEAIFVFLSGPCECAVEELSAMGLREFIDTIEEFIALNAEDLKYFFEKALGLIKKK